MKNKKILKKLLSGMVVGTMVFGLTACGSAEKTEDANTDVRETEETSGEETDTEVQEAEEENGDSKEQNAGELIPLRIGVGGQDDSYIMELGTFAYTQGYLEEELNAVGYTFDPYIFKQTGPEVNEALASGALDGAIYGDLPAFTSKSNGIDTTIIATANPKAQYAILTVGDAIQKPKDLEGKRVVVMQGTVMQYFWEQYVAENGIDAGKVEIINSPDAASLLQTGEADAYVAVAYVVKYMEELGIGRLFDDSGDLENGSTTTVVTLKNDFLAEHPEVAVAINKALIRAYNDATDDPNSFYNAIATPKMSAEVMKTAYQFDPTLSYLTPQLSEDVMQYYEKFDSWLYDHSIISEKVDLNELVDASYYDQAVSELGQ